MREFTSSALFIILAKTVLFLGVAVADSKQAKIGYVIPLSGDWALLGQGIKNGALLASEDLPLNERPQLIFDDNQGEISKSVTAATRLINLEGVDAIVSIISGVALAIRPIAERKSVISVGICSDTGASDGKLAFINYLTATEGVKAYFNHLTEIEKLPISLSIIQMNDPGFERIARLVSEKGSSFGVKVEAIESYDKGLTDFKSLLLRVSTKKPSTVLLLGLSPELELIAKQNQEAKLGLRFSSIESFGLIADKTPFNESWFVDSAYPSDEFVARYEEKFKTEITAGVGHSYETVRLLSKSLLLRKPLNTFNNSELATGILGRLYVGKDGVISTSPSIKLIRNGNVERVK